MSYKMELPEKMLKDLYNLRMYCGERSIIDQVRSAVRTHIKEQERKIGTTVEDLTEAIERHEAESNQKL